MSADLGRIGLASDDNVHNISMPAFSLPNKVKYLNNQTKFLALNLRNVGSKDLRLILIQSIMVYPECEPDKFCFYVESTY